MEAVPGLRHMAVIADSNETAPRHLQALQDAARALGVEFSIHQIASAEEITAAIDAAKASGASALNVLPSPFLSGNAKTIMQRAAIVRLPAIYPFPELAEQGGFAAYGPSLIQLFRELLAHQLIKLLRGVKPADIPIEQPTKFEPNRECAGYYGARDIAGPRRQGNRVKGCGDYWPLRRWSCGDSAEV
jgi:putative tryptophan/tyrosine transport system substrate-binding protein